MSLTYMGISLCFFCSIVYHVFNTSTMQMSSFLSQVDYFGIILHIICLMLSLVYFAYYNHPLKQFCFLVMFVVIGCICLFMNYHCMFNTCNKKMSGQVRVTFFISLVIFSVPPQVEIGTLYSWKLFVQTLATDMCYVFAALVYLFKYPERAFPGKFDLFNSHCLFHVFIIISSFMAFFSLDSVSKAALEYSKKNAI